MPSSDPNLIPVANHAGLARSSKSKAILATDKDVIRKYKAQRQHHEKTNQKLIQLSTELNAVKGRLSTIEKLLESLGK